MNTEDEIKILKQDLYNLKESFRIIIWQHEGRLNGLNDELIKLKNKKEK